MPTDQPNPPPATKQSPEEAAKQAAADKATHERIWESPIGAGTPIPFDPSVHQPPLSKEELDELLGKQEKE